MSNNILSLCKFRESVADDSTKDDVLEIMNLFKNQIDAERFFTESYFTEGMNILLRTAFARFEGKDDHGIVKLTQNMGGGKTHSMVTLGLLAKHPEFREKFLGNASFKGNVRVIGFSGRQTDTELGIWGELAKQLGKEDEFKKYYNPQFAAPGNEAWINLLKGEPTLILLDELPPYLVSAKSRTVGNSDLSVVTATALANLFNAIKENQLSNVLIVMSDLSGNWAEGTEIIREVLNNLRSELSRVSLNLTPVNNQSNELVEILKTKLIEKLPSDEQIRNVAEQYKVSLNEAKQMGLTNSNPNDLYTQIIQTYPFHPSFIDLYNRFKENEGFQQTRGVIRLVRSMLKDLVEEKSDVMLIAPHDINLTNPSIRTTIEQLNPNLSGAMRHDINNNGSSVAEIEDKKSGGTLVQDLAKLLLVSSLSNVAGGLKGLNASEIVTDIIKPSIKPSQIKPSLETLANSAWYLAVDNDNRFHFQHIQNLIAQLKNLVDGYDDESARKEIKQYLEEELKPSKKDCYQKVQIFPGIDELDVESKKVTLIVTEPSSITSGISKELTDYWRQHSFKNRFLILSGERQTWDSLTNVFKEYKGIQAILANLIDERTSESDPQYKKAIDKRDKIHVAITSAIRETFVTVYFPRNDGSGDELDKAEISFQFTNNAFNAEEQITNLLKEERKFTDNIEVPSFRTMVEEKLFGPEQAEIKWENLKDNAARNCRWTWHHPQALDNLRTKALSEGMWRDNGGYIEKGPFPKEPTSVEVKYLDYNRETKETFIKLTAKYGDRIYIDTNENVSEASKLIENIDYFKLTNFTNFFLCIDSTGEHKNGEVLPYNVPLKITYRFFDDNGSKKLELQVNCGAVIKYTTDGSDPKHNGGNYDEPFSIPENATFVRVVAHVGDVYGEIEDLIVPSRDKPFEIVDNTPVNYSHRVTTSDNTETYLLLEELGALKGKLSLNSIDLKFGNDSSKFISINIGEGVGLDCEQVQTLIKNIRDIMSINEDVANVELTIRKLHFPDGLAFKHYASKHRINLSDLSPNDIEQ